MRRQRFLEILVKISNTLCQILDELVKINNKIQKK